MNEPLDYAALKKRIDTRVERQKRMTGWILLIVNIGIFLLFLGITFSVVNGTPAIRGVLNNEATSDIALAIILPFVGWMLAILYHGISMIVRDQNSDSRFRKQILANEMGSLMYQQVAQAAAVQAEEHLAKPKRASEEPEGRYVEIGDDGELIDLPQDEPLRRRRE